MRAVRIVATGNRMTGSCSGMFYLAISENYLLITKGKSTTIESEL